MFLLDFDVSDLVIRKFYLRDDSFFFSFLMFYDVLIYYDYNMDFCI